MGVEREVKLAADGAFELPDLAGVVEGAAAVALPEEKLDASYHDTADLRLARWGVTVRFRREGRAGAWWTVKLPDDATLRDGLARDELAFPGGPGAMPPDALRLLTAYVRGASLAPVARLVTRRRRTQLVDAAGAAIAEVDDDVVAVMDGRHVVARFREIEIEALAPGGDRVLGPVRDALVRAGARPTVPVPKVIRALGARAADAPEVAAVEVGHWATAGQVVRAAIGSGVTRMLRHDPGVRLGEDPEAVHQARVGTRRLRSDLRTFRRLLEAEWVGPTREALGWVAGALGAVRDDDVLLERLRGQVLVLPAADRNAARALLRRLETQRALHREELLAVLDSPRYTAFLDRLVGAAAAPPLTGAAAAPALEVLPDLVRRPWRHLARAVDRLPEDPEPEALHRVRVRAKRSRYAAESAEAVMGKPARRLAAAVADVQAVLGDLNDAVVAEAWLRQAAHGSAAQALVAGQLVALQREEVAAARAAWPAAWAAASRKKLRSWLT
ncbi:MAG TPA: CYTH and CHAD domain-containing protein [Acidimicrobiales bacterium]